MQQLIVGLLLLGACSALDSSEGEVSVMTNVFDKCPRGSDFVSCWKLRAVRLLDRAFNVDSLPVFDFVSVEKNPFVVDQSHLPTGDALEASLPRDLHQKNTALDRILLDKLWSYLNTRTLKMNLSTDVYEGRKKDGMKMKKKGKKGGMMMMMAGAVGAMMMQMALGKITLIAGKALLISKLALLLAAVLGLKSLLSQGQDEVHTSQVIVTEPDMHGGWARDSIVPEVAHDLAYMGQPSFRSRQVGTASSIPVH